MLRDAVQSQGWFLPGTDGVPAGALIGGWCVPPDSDDLRAYLVGHGASWPVRHVTSRGLLLEPRKDAGAMIPGEGTVRISDGRRILAPIPVRVRPSRENGAAGASVEFRHRDVPLRTARTLHHVLEEMRLDGRLLPAVPPAKPVVEEVIDEPERVRDVVRSLMANRCSGSVLGGDAPPVPVRAACWCPGSPRPVRFGIDGTLPPAPRTIRLVGPYSFFDLPIVDPALEDGLLAIALPAVVRRTRHRFARRGAPPDGTGIAFRHPLWGRVRVCQAVADLSAGGLSFVAEPVRDLLIPGLEIPELQVLAAGRPVATFRASLRRIGGGEGATVAGLQLFPRGEAEARNWQEFVQDAFHPATSSRGGRLDDWWSLFTESGYFNLSHSTPEDFAELQRSFEVATRAIEAAPDVGCQGIFPSPRGLEASSTIHRIYDGTWFPGQLAKRKGSGGGVPCRQVLRDVNLRPFEHAMHDPDLRWIMAFVHETARWTQAPYRDFPLRHVDSGDAWVMPFEAWIDRADATDEAPTLAIRRATPADKRSLVRTVQRSRPWQYADALDLVPERLDLQAVAARWARAGMCREREIVVARRGRTTLAAAVLEAGEPGSHVFGLYDAVRLFPMAKGGEAAFGDLLRMARRWYRARGRKGFVYCCEHGDTLHAEEAGLRRLGKANLMMFSRKVLPDFLECICEITAPCEAAQEQV